MSDTHRAPTGEDGEQASSRRAPDGGSGDGEPWYRAWFGRDYLQLYPHRDEEEAGRGVELFLRHAALETGSRVLDLACGPGRHLVHLAEASLEAVGLDLSTALLHEARDRLRDRADRLGPGTARRLVRGDMRWLPFRDGGFDGVTLFFTSFGYFEDHRDDRRTLEEARRVLRRGGTLLLDFLNADRVRRDLVPEDEQTVEGHTVRQTREIRDGRVVKRIEIEPEREGAETRVYHERVRLYEPRELVRLLEARGLSVTARFGDYAGGTHATDSPRLILLARAEG